MTEHPHFFTLDAKAEFNMGPSEDSDFLKPGEPTEVLPVGEISNGALPVKIRRPGEKKFSDQIYFFHQCEPAPAG